MTNLPQSPKFDDDLTALFEDICSSFYWEGADPEDVRRDEFPEWITRVKKAVYHQIVAEYKHLRRDDDTHEQLNQRIIQAIKHVTGIEDPAKNS